MNGTVLAALVSPRPHDARRSLALVRVVVAGFIAAHPLYTLVHADAREAMVHALAQRGLPGPAALTWAALLAVLGCSVALLAGRFVAPAALGLIVVLVAGIALLYAPYWYVAGGAANDEHPGAEFNVLLIICLASVLWAAWPRAASRTQQALDLLRVGVGVVLLPHPLHPFLSWDVEGMHAFGEGMSKLGMPFGVQLVWVMVPACAGLIFILGMGTVIVHYSDWFIVGLGGNGMEFPLTYITSYVALIVAYWPRRGTGAALGQPIDIAVEGAGIEKYC